MSDSLIPLVCPACQARMNAPAAMAGRAAKCPKCRAEVQVGAAPIKPTTSTEAANQDDDTPNDVGRLVRVTVRACEAFDHLLDQDNVAAGMERLDAAGRFADGFAAANPQKAAGWLATGLVLARRGNLTDAADRFTTAVRLDAASIAERELAPLVDTFAAYYSTITFVSEERLGLPVPEGKKELVAALRKVLVLADREVPRPGEAADKLAERVRGLQEERPTQTKPTAVTCPACQEGLKGFVARCPHCTSVLNWMDCPACQRKVSARVTQKFVGVARGGHQPVYHCSRCGKKLAGPDCFVATAAYGSAQEPGVETLRAFRDKVLVRWAAGRAFVVGYYAVSPPLAAAIRDRPKWRRAVRVLLAPVVWAAGRVVGRSKPG